MTCASICRCGQWSSPRPRAALARLILAEAMDRAGVRAMLPDGSQLGRRGVADPAAPTLEIVRPAELFDRVGRHPKIGIGEGYVAGDWCPATGHDLADLLVPFARRLADAVPPWLLRLRAVVDRPIPRAHRNSPAGARRNISAHYDLSNEMFAAFLDETMTYSSALFDDRVPFGEQDLADAQRRKMDRVLDLARVDQGSQVLEIGTGWGALAVRAAERGATVTTLTLSGEQAQIARQRARDHGVADRVDVRLCDYREATGRYDAVVSVEMIEAVGEEYWPSYFEAIRRRLVPDGVAVVQAIVMSHERLLATRRSWGWIQKHVFPGGLIPSLTAIQQTSGAAGLRVSHVDTFGEHYAHTLAVWRRRFDDNWPAIRALGFPDDFRRLWEFYLAYSQAGFATGYLDVAHVVLRPAGQVRRAGYR